MSTSEVLLDEYEFISKYGEGLEVNLWMEQAVQVIKELKDEIQRLAEYEWMYKELSK